MILDTRERQLHDEPLSCGTQSAYIRLINRRFAACFALSALLKQGINLIKTKTTVYLTGQYISGACAAEGVEAKNQLSEDRFWLFLRQYRMY